MNSHEDPKPMHPAESPAGMVYRWNPARRLWEYWSWGGWTTSATYEAFTNAAADAEAIALLDPIVSYDDTWCEPSEVY
jgi:hypothetical protein